MIERNIYAQDVFLISITSVRFKTICQNVRTK